MRLHIGFLFFGSEKKAYPLKNPMVLWKRFERSYSFAYSILERLARKFFKKAPVHFPIVAKEKMEVEYVTIREGRTIQKRVELIREHIFLFHYQKGESVFSNRFIGSARSFRGYFDFNVMLRIPVAQ
jgi:hypothetical protein